MACMISCWFLYIGVNKGCLGVHTKRENPIKNLCNKKRTDDCVLTYVVFLKTFNRTNDFKYKNGTRVGQTLGANCLRTGIENCVTSTMTVHEGKTRLQVYDAWNLFIHFSMALVSTYVSYCWSLIIKSDPWDDDVVMMTQRRDKSHGHSMPMISEKDIYKQTHIKLCLIDRDKFADKALVKPGN